MRKDARAEFRQGHNAQARVVADGSHLILGHGVTRNANDKGELANGCRPVWRKSRCRRSSNPVYNSADEGHLVILDRRKVPWSERVFRRSEPTDAGAVEVWGM